MVEQNKIYAYKEEISYMLNFFSFILKMSADYDKASSLLQAFEEISRKDDEAKQEWLSKLIVEIPSYFEHHLQLNSFLYDDEFTFIGEYLAEAEEIQDMPQVLDIYVRLSGAGKVFADFGE